jgi:hypothetical protein
MGITGLLRGRFESLFYEDDEINYFGHLGHLRETKDLAAKVAKLGHLRDKDLAVRVSRSVHFGHAIDSRIRGTSPHPLADHHVCGPDENEGPRWLRVGQHKRKGIHSGVKDSSGLDRPSGSVIEPGKDDGKRDHENHPEK